MPARSRTTFVRDAAKFARSCGEQGADWETTWTQIEGGAAMAGVELGSDERMALYETWDAAFPWAEEAAA